MCTKNYTHIYVVRTSNNRVISIVACCHSVKLCALSDRNNIKYGFFLPRPEVKNQVMSHLHNACFAILNIATSFCVMQNFEVVYKMRLNFTANSFVFKPINHGNMPRTLLVKLASEELPKCI